MSESIPLKKTMFQWSAASAWLNNYLESKQIEDTTNCNVEQDH